LSKRVAVNVNEGTIFVFYKNIKELINERLMAKNKKMLPLQ